VKILFLTDGLFPFVIGGMQKHSSILLKLLAENGMEIHVFHPGGVNYSSEKFAEKFKSKSENRITETQIDFPEFFQLPGHYLRENRKYSELCFKTIEKKLNQFDLIYAQGFTGWHFLKEKRKKTFSIPIIVNFHGYGEFQKAPEFRTALAYLMLRPGIKYNTINADYVYSFGGVIDIILSKIGISNSKILRQANGIEKDWITNEPKSHSKRTFVFIGRDERRKGLVELNSVLTNIEINGKAIFDFHFIGSFKESSKLKSDNFQYHGELSDQNQLISILDKCDCLVLPSYAEGMPTVILEAMARGLVIIATDVGAVSEQIEGNGLLLPRPEIASLQKAIETILCLSEDELFEMKQKSIELVKKKFLWSKIVESKINDFHQITKSKLS